MLESIHPINQSESNQMTFQDTFRLKEIIVTLYIIIYLLFNSQLYLL